MLSFDSPDEVREFKANARVELVDLATAQIAALQPAESALIWPR
jgi:hypothetical protein